MKTYSLHEYKLTTKYVLFGLGVIISTVSLAYTRYLAEQLKEIEIKQVELYIKAIEASYHPNAEARALEILETDVLQSEHAIPVILTDTLGKPIFTRNINIERGLELDAQAGVLEAYIEKMRSKYDPIELELSENESQLVYYEHSDLTRSLNYFPYIQLSTIGIYALFSYLIFSSFRRSEQNRVWAGLTKETAHQLSTPISGLMAWIAFLRQTQSVQHNVVNEMERDIKRLENITDRFANIGSKPAMTSLDITTLVEKTVNYLEKRISKKVRITVVDRIGDELVSYANASLMGWVVENICKNAVDAMHGRGRIRIYIRKHPKKEIILIDFRDTGPGIPSKDARKIFMPGFSSKQGSWGLGLTLVKRIVTEYHHGKIAVIHTNLKQGACIRVSLPAHPEQVTS